jgi:hypothetical protein
MVSPSSFIWAKSIGHGTGTAERRITSVFPCVARGFKACASFKFTGCCWWRSLAVDGDPGTSRGHALARSCCVVQVLGYPASSHGTGTVFLSVARLGPSRSVRCCQMGQLTGLSDRNLVQARPGSFMAGVSKCVSKIGSLPAMQSLFVPKPSQRAIGLPHLAADLQLVVRCSPLVCGLGRWHRHSVSHPAARSDPLLAKIVRPLT